LLLLANATHSVGVLKAWRAKSSLPFVMNLSGQANGFFASNLKGYSGAAAFVTATPSPWGKKYAMQREYHSGMDAAGLTNYSYLSFEAYTNARVAIDAIKRAKNRSPAALKAALDNTAFMVAGLEWRFDAKTPGRFTDMAVLKSDGTFMH
jgi:ABC-type branched-subunit amino acid transport system substrate-binding protein